MKIKSSINNTIIEYAICLVIGLIVGLKMIPANFIGVVYLMLSMASLYFASQGDNETALSILAYPIYTERYIKNEVTFIPFLYLQYFISALFLFMIFRQKKSFSKMHSRAFISLILYTLIELIDSSRANDPIYARSLYINTIAITVAATWGAFNFLTPKNMNRILNHVKLASVFLCGYILARQLFGEEISYSLSSMSESMNGLSAVQLSGYLGVAASIFFFSLMDEKEKSQFWLNLALLTVMTTLMILSFSRGGIYFLGIIMAVFFFLNRTKLKSYLLLLLFIPIGFGVYSYVTEKTHGIVEERYGEEGNSGRTDLVKAAFELFVMNPLAGVGTGNYGESIKENKLYSGESGVHNEFARSAAEHGILGIITYWFFFFLLTVEILQRKKVQREYALYFLLLFSLITVHNGLKISVQPYILAFAVATPSLIKTKKKQIHVPASKELETGY